MGYTLRRRSTALAVLLAVAIVPYFLDLGGSSIWDANEAFYVETPREMMEQRDYVTPTFNYEPRLNKPVLSYWIVAGFYHVFGVSVAVQRVPIAVAALILILTACCLARAASTNGGTGEQQPPANRPGRATEAALWAGLGLAVTPRLLMFARRIFIDVYISMFFGLTLLFFVLAERRPERRRTFLLLMYVAAGLGMLTKGPVAIVLPALAFGLYLLVHGELRRLGSMMLPAGALIVLAIVAPWYVALYLRHGWAPMAEFIFGENVARYTAGVGVDSERGPLFYLPVLISDSFPWSMFLGAAAIGWWRARRAGAGSEPAQRIQSAAGDLGRGLRGVLQRIRREAGSLHLSDRAGRGSTGGRHDRGSAHRGRALDQRRHRRDHRAGRRAGSSICSARARACTRCAVRWRWG